MRHPPLPTRTRTALAALPTDRRAALSAVRKAITENLPDGYEEGMPPRVERREG